jgi:hypothetical protein
VALLVATYDYQDAGLRRLTAPAHDAEALAAVLGDPDIAGFEVTTLVNEAHYRVGAAIGDFYRDRRRDDLTLLYFTGHGVKDDEGRLYLAMADTRRDGLLFTGLAAEQIDRAMEGCASRQKVLILDCCYSGAFPAGRIAKADDQVHALERFHGRGRTVLTASDATQYSFEGNQLHGEAPRSVFTHHLVAGLRDGTADLDGDGDITLDELYAYVHDRVVAEMPQQRPKKQDDVEGRMVIARNVRWSLPVYVTNAVASPLANDRAAALDGLGHLYRTGNDLVRARVLTEIERLTDDDSRSVSTAATILLASLDAQPTTPSAPQPAPAEPPAGPSPATDRPTPIPTEPPAEPEQVASASPQPLAGPGPVVPTLAESSRESEAVVEAVVAERVEPPGPRRGWRRRAVAVLRAVRRVGLAGWCAVVAGALLVAAVVATYARGFSSGWPPALWYLMGIAALVIGAAVGMLVPRTRRLVGPGVLVAAGAAAAWGLVYYPELLLYLAGPAVRDRGDPPVWLALGGHVTVVTAAVLAGWALRRDPAVRVEVRLPRSVRTWSAVALAGAAAVAGALAMYDTVRTVAHLNTVYVNPVIGAVAQACLATSILAAVVPAVAAVLGPYRLRLALLAGWAGGAVAIALGSSQRGGTLADNTSTLTFGGAALVLAGAAALAGWRARTRPLAGRRLALAGVAAVCLVAAGAGTAVYQVAAAPVTEAVPWAAAVSPDGTRLYVAADLWTSNTPRYTRDGRPGRLWIVDTASHHVVGDPVPVGRAVGAVAVSADGRYAYVCNQRDGAVTVVSTRERATVGSPLRVGGKPRPAVAGRQPPVRPDRLRPAVGGHHHQPRHRRRDPLG